MSAVLDFPALPDTTPTTAVALLSIKDNVLAQFRATEAALRALAEKYRAVAFDVSTPKGLAAAREARNELREQGRYAVQRAETRIKGEVNELKKAMSDEAARLVAIVAPVEEHVDQQIKARETQIAAEKAERERIEAERIAGHERGLAVIRGYVRCAVGLSAERIALGIDALRAMSFGAAWEEFAPLAEQARASTISDLERMHAAAAERAAEAARLEAQRMEQERIAAAQRAESERLAAQAAELKRQADELAEARRLEGERLSAQVSGNPGELMAGPSAPASEERCFIGRVWDEANKAAEKPIIAVEVDTTPPPAPPAQEEPPTLLLGVIAARLGFPLRQDFIEQRLGVQSSGRQKAAVLFHESDWPRIKQALIDYVRALP